MKNTKTTSSTEQFFLDDPWGAIDRPCYPEGRRLYLRDERFWVSMDQEHQLLFFIQDCGGEDVETLENLAGLEVAMEMQANGDSRLLCKLTSADKDLQEKFSTVAKDIAFHCSSYEGTKLFMKAQERIRSWANFLKPSRSGLTNAEFIGFFGELYFLSQQLMPAIDPAGAIRAWIGPEGKKQDFTLNDWAIEVKTSSSGDSQFVTISSLDQLDKITDRLFLVRVILSPATVGDGFSLGELYEDCLATVSHDIVTEGLYLQKASKLFGKASEKQLSDQYKVVDLITYGVTEDFPRLTSENVPLAIQDASYQLSISAISGFALRAPIEEIVKHG